MNPFFSQRSFAGTTVCLLIIVAALEISAAPAGSVVTVNSNNVLVLNGRPVFTIGFSPGPPNNSTNAAGKDAMQELHDAGALLVRMPQSTDWSAQVIADQQAALDWAALHGMYCWVNLRELSKFSASDTATPASLRSVVDTFRNHPALGLWKNFDEAWWGGVPVADLKRGYDVIKQEDTNHPIVQTHAPRGTVADLQPYNVAADVLALDIYPVGYPPGANSLLTNKEISMVGDWASFLGQVANGEKQYWMVEQIAWSGVVPPAKTLRFPTFAQERYMAYQAIINGARGLMFFGGNVTATMTPQDAALGWNWTFWDQTLKRVVQELGDGSLLTPALVAPNSTLPITLSGTSAPDIEFCVREAPPYLYILAAKREGTTIQASFSGLPAGAGTGELLYEGPRAVTATNGQFTDWFGPFEVHAYRFNLTNQNPVIVSQPQSRTNIAGTTATFGVTASGATSYQWRKNGNTLLNGGNVSGAASATLVLSSVSQTDAAGYDVIVSGVGSVTSAPPAVLTVVNYQTNQIPTISAPPQSQTNAAGATVNFAVGVTGNGPFGYQWRKNGAPLLDGGNVSGSGSANLMLANISAADVAGYDVVVIGYTSVTSSPLATLTVTNLPPNPSILYEPFNYFNTGSPVSSNTPGNWTFNGSGVNDLNVTAGSLNYSGLATSIGNSVTNGGVGLGARRLFGTSVNSNALYFSALFRVNNLGYGVWNGASSQVGAFTAPDNTSFRLAVMIKSNSPSGYVLGVQKGGSGVTTTFDSTEYHAGDTVLLVGRYDFNASPNAVSLWINPPASTFGAGAAPAGGFIAASSGSDGLAIDRFNIRQNTAASVPAAMQWDELRVGTAWGVVTPPYTTPPPGFSMVTTPGSLSTGPGGSVSYSLSVTGQVGFAGDVFLSVAGLPPGISASVSPAVIHNFGNAAVQVSASSLATTGTYPITVTGTTSNLTNYASAIFVVDPAVRAWGDNVYGQVLVPASLSNNIIAISGGAYHNLALRSNGLVVAWGDNSSGQCAVPVDATNIIAIAAGGYHSLALRGDGSVLGWGQNDYGQTTAPPGATNLVALSAGSWHSLGLRADGSVVAWGDNSFGQAAVPAGLTNIVAIAAGGEHSVALRSDGTVLAWGRNSGPYGSYAGQIDVPSGLSQVVAIDAGGYHSMALRSDGSIVAWGDNSSGQASVPAGLPRAVNIAAGDLHSVALLEGGTAAAWGDDAQGQCSLDPTMRGVTAISAGSYHTLTLVGPGPLSPNLAAQAVAPQTANVSVQSTPGKVYILEYKNSLGDPVWLWGKAIVGDGGKRTFGDSLTGKAARFYRVREQ
jgi:hypothetical protein